MNNGRTPYIAFAIALGLCLPMAVMAEDEQEVEVIVTTVVESSTDDIVKPDPETMDLLSDQEEELVRNLEKEQKTDGIRWMATGVDTDSRESAKKLDFPVRLEFAQGREYLSFVHVTVTDANDEVVFKQWSAGPWLLLDLPAGAYEAQAKAKDLDDKKSAALNVTSGQRQQSTLLRWPAQ